jgi:hypothetical protein
MGCLAPVQVPAAAGPGPVIPRGVQPGGHDAFACLRDRDRRGMQQRGNGLDRLPLSGQQQRMRPAYRAGGGRPFWDERTEQLTLVVTQLHAILLGQGSLLAEGSVPKNADKRNWCN